MARDLTAPGRLAGRLTMLLLTWVLLTGCAAPDLRQEASPAPRPTWAGMEAPAGYRLPDVSLTDTKGHSYNLRSTSTAPAMVVTFGYCDSPRLTPQTLSRLKEGLAGLDAAQRAEVEVVVITIDPAHDSAKDLDACLEAYDPDWVGLHGSLSTVTDVANAMGVDFRSKLGKGKERYAYSAQIIAFGPDRTACVVWLPDHDAATIAADLATLTAIG